jgi:signal transduction histidine kinase
VTKTAAEVRREVPLEPAERFERAFDVERGETIQTRSRWIWGGSLALFSATLVFIDRAVFTWAQALTIRVPEIVLALSMLQYLRKPRERSAIERRTMLAWSVVALLASWGFTVVPAEKLPAKVAALTLSVIVVCTLGAYTWQTSLVIALITLASLTSLLHVGANSLYMLTMTVVGFAWGVIIVSAAARDRLKRKELVSRLALVEANEKLQREDELKRRLFVNLSHDLRTPLAVVRGEAAMLRVSGRLVEDDAALARVERNAAALSQLADQLLDLARLEAGQMPVRARACDVGAIVRDIAAQLAPPGVPRVLTRVEGEGARVVSRVDPSHLQRIVTNLVANALRQPKSATDPGLVTLVVRHASATDRVEVDVVDEGPGVPPERREVIFTRFVSFDSDGNTASGIGLPLARELALVNAGTLELLDVQPTTFRLSLPATTEAPDPIDTLTALSPVPVPVPALLSSPPPGSRPRRRILVVEDNPDMGLLLVRALGSAYRVEHVTRVADALAVLTADPPTAVLSDVMLPDGNGYDVLAAIRSRRDLDRMPVVLVSALGEVEERVRGLSAGADDYVPKPFAPEELRSRMDAAIERAETWSQALAAQRDVLLMEVHDGVSASLSRASILLSDLEPQLASRDAHDTSSEAALGVETIAHAREAIRDGLDEVRAITRLLAPKAATFQALSAEIRRAMGDACAAARLELVFDVASNAELDVATVPAGTAHTIRRVAREATTNAIKHARAKTLACHLSATSDSFVLRIQDDGRGLPEQRTDGQGLGIMSRRVGRVGGTVEHGSRAKEAGGGAYVEVRLPRLAR